MVASPALRILTASLISGLLVSSFSSSVAAYQRPGRNELISIGNKGERIEPVAYADGIPRNLSISPNGRFIAFDSDSPQLAPDKPNTTHDVFLYDRFKDRIELVSRSDHALLGMATPIDDLIDPAAGNSKYPAISANGRYVAFQSGEILTDDDQDLNSDVYLRDRKAGKTILISKPELSIGKEELCDGESNAVEDLLGTILPGPMGYFEPSMSDDGRFVGYIGADSNGLCSEFFVHDRKTGKTMLVSGIERPSAERETCASISPSGRYAVFTRTGDTQAVPPWEPQEVYFRDLRTDKIEQLTGAGGRGLSTSAANRSHACGRDSISSDGRFVTFESERTDLVPNDTNGGPLGATWDMFVFDRSSNRMVRASISSDGSEHCTQTRTGFCQGGGINPAISADGSTVVYQSGVHPAKASGGPCNGATGNYVLAYILATGALECSSVSFNGEASMAGDQDSSEREPVPNANGRYIAFTSSASNLVKNDTNDYWDAFVRDRGVRFTVGDLVASDRAKSLRLDGSPGFANTGTALFSDARDDSESLTSATELIGGQLTYRPLLGDIFVVLEIQHMPLTPMLASVTAGHVFGLSFMLDGHPYELRATSTGVGRSLETTATFELFSCASRSLLGCIQVATLGGGFGTTGHRITFSLPTELIDLRDGSHLSDLRAYTALGNISGKPSQVLDTAAVHVGH